MKENKFPKVTVIIINFNNSKLINRCVKSVLSQTYSNLEIIFVDDSSTDNSIQIAKEFLSKNNIKKFRLLNKFG